MNGAMAELQRLAEVEARLRDRIDEVNTAARFAQAELVAAREKLIQLEADGANAQKRGQAEKRLADATKATGEPWSERVQGAERAAQAAHDEVIRYATRNLAALIDGLEENGRAAAGQVDHAAQAFLDACQARVQAETELTAVVALTRRMNPGDIAHSRADEARLAVQALIERGGEAAPVVRVELPVVAA
jgi:hypothetical protein